MFGALILALIINLVIPAIGYFVSNWILNDIGSKIEIDPVIACNIFAENNVREMKSVCELVENLSLLQNASIGVAAACLGLIILYIFTGLICGKNRLLNSIIFPILIPLTTIIISIGFLADGAIITYAAYIGESWLIGRVHFILIGGIGLASIVGAMKLITSIFSIKNDIDLFQLAKLIDKDDQSDMWDFVNSIANDLKSKPPDNIIVGLQPTFYATGANVKILGKETLKGETLFISLPLMRLFNKEELKSVIGHELGHFRGSDIHYTLKFAPVYRGLQHSISELNEDASIVNIPAISMLSFMMQIFSINERRISREREFEADNAAISVSSSDVFAMALGKVSVYSGLWKFLQQNNIKRLNEGKISPNLSLIFEDSSRYDISHENVKNVLEQILQTRVSHPTDTHPTTFERYENINFDYQKMNIEELTKKGKSSASLINNLDSIEEELTQVEHHVMIELGHADLPEDTETESAGYLNAIYTLAAGMVCADGKVLPEEINEAEAIGKSLFENFDSVDFRAFCNNFDEIPHFEKVVDIFGKSLDSDQKKIIYDYLKKIALSDDDFDETEQKLLENLSKKWKLKIK